MEDIKKQINFINELEKLKCVKRHNYTLDSNRLENSAEHSWHIAMMAILLFNHKQKELDQLKVIKMLLVHDIVEIYAGDAFLFDEQARKNAVEKERSSLEKLIQLLPDEQGEELKNLWLEFEAKETEEAKFANSLDGLPPLLNHYYVKEDGFNPDNISKDQVVEKKSFIQQFTPSLWPITEEIIYKSRDKGLYH